MQSKSFVHLSGWRTLLALFLLFSFLCNTRPILAQEDGGDGTDDTENEETTTTGNASLLVRSPSTLNFPLVRFYMEAYDQDGRFITTMYPSAVEVVEDEQTLIANEITLKEPGLQFTVALNPGVMFMNTYLGYTNWDRVVYAIQTWAESLPPGKPDDFSFVGGETYSQTHYTSPRSFSKIFDDYTPNFLGENPALYSLTTALEIAAETTKDEHSKRSILWITPPLNNTLLEILPQLIDQAETLDVQVNVWLVGTAASAESSSAPVMKELAERTGGNFFIYTGLEFLPDIEEYVQPRRYYYEAGYYSQVTQPGDHEFMVNLYWEALELHSAKQSFNIILESPRPIFLSPPSTLALDWNIPSNAIEPVITPDTINFDLLVEFPDGIQRPITASRLYIDGEMVAENTSAPFDRLTWKIDETQQGGMVSIQAEIVDTLGYTSQTVELPLNITVADKPITFFSNTRLVTAVAIGAAALVLLAVIIFAERRRSHPKEDAETVRKRNDPLTQPVSIPQEPVPPPKTKSQPVISLTAPFYQESQPARLTYMGELAATAFQKVILLKEDDTIIGSDERYADVLLQKPTISPQHAHIIREQSGSFRLIDCDSLAGTWLNYAPVTRRGILLKDGDLIQLGQEVFRYEAAIFHKTELPESTENARSATP